MNGQGNGTELQQKLVVEPIVASFNDWLNQPFISASLREELANTDVLFVPKTDFRDTTHPLFPEGTESLFRFVKDNSPHYIHVEICTEDEDYKELALHFAIYDLGSVIATLLAAPVVAQLIANYIQAHIDRKRKEQVKFEMTVIEQGGRATRIYYEGSAEQFEHQVVPTIQALNLDGEVLQVQPQLTSASVIHDEHKGC